MNQTEQKRKKQKRDDVDMVLISPKRPFFSVNPIFAIARGNRDSQHRWCATRRENEEKETRETRERKRERLKTKEDIQTKQLKREVKKQKIEIKNKQKRIYTNSKIKNDKQRNTYRTSTIKNEIIETDGTKLDKIQIKVE